MPPNEGDSTGHGLKGRCTVTGSEPASLASPPAQNKDNMPRADSCVSSDLPWMPFQLPSRAHVSIPFFQKGRQATVIATSKIPCFGRTETMTTPQHGQVQTSSRCERTNSARSQHDANRYPLQGETAGMLTVLSLGTILSVAAVLCAVRSRQAAAALTQAGAPSSP